MTAAELETEETQKEEIEQKGSKDESKAYNRVTDVVMERELDSKKVQDAMMRLAVTTREQEQRERERERELSKVVIQQGDVDIIVQEFEMDKKKAERVLREHGGDVIVALQFLVNEWPEGEPPKAAKDAGDYIEPLWPPQTKKKPLPVEATKATPPSAPAPAAPAASTASANSRPNSSRPSSAKPKGKKKK